MALTPEQEARFRELDAKFGSSSPTTPPQNKIDQDKINRFKELDAKFGRREEDRSIVMKLVNMVDSVFGAPVRGAVGNIVGTEKRGFTPETAPTGEELAIAEGFSTEKNIPVPVPNYDLFNPESGMIPENKKGIVDTKKVSPAQVAGTVQDVVLDASLVLPVGKAAKEAFRYAKYLKGSKAEKEALETIVKTTKGVPTIEQAPELIQSRAISPEELSKSKEDIKKIMKSSKISGVLKGIFRGAKGSADELIEVTPAAEDLVQHLDTVKRFGLAKDGVLETTEFGRDSIIGKLMTKVAETGGPVKRKYIAEQNAIQKAIDKRIDDIGEIIPNDHLAGKELKANYIKKRNEFFNQMDSTDDSVIKSLKSVEELTIPQENKKSLFDLVERLKTEVEDAKTIRSSETMKIKRVLNMAEAATNDVTSLDQLKRSMKIVGKSAFPDKTSLSAAPTDVGLSKELYRTMRGVFDSSVGSKLGEDVLTSLKANNKKMSEFFGNESYISKEIGNSKIAPEDLFNKVIIKGDSNVLDALKEVLDAKVYDKMRATYLHRVMKKNASSRMPYASTYNALTSREESHIVDRLISSNELKDLKDLLQYGDSLGPPIAGPSSAGVSLENIGVHAKNKAMNRAYIESSIQRSRAQRAKGIIDNKEAKGFEALKGK